MTIAEKEDKSLDPLGYFPQWNRKLKIREKDEAMEEKKPKPPPPKPRTLS